MSQSELQARYAALFQGLDIAHGTGKGQWIPRGATATDYLRHLEGRGPGIGIGPLRQDNTVLFAAIDLDEPDFVAAREMQNYLPGPSFLEHSRSGNAHVWVFFSEPIEAWLAMGVLKEATFAAGKDHVEVFPKNPDFAKVTYGNYINLPYHGDTRKVERTEDEYYTLEEFVDAAEADKNTPQKWQNAANWMQLSSPADKREGGEHTEFGTQEYLHVCAEHVLSGDAGPVTEGHRSVVYFCLAKQLFNCVMYDRDEVVEQLVSLNQFSTPHDIPENELMRIIGNAERGQFTSTGCDDPLFAPYAHPECKIAHHRN